MTYSPIMEHLFLGLCTCRSTEKYIFDFLAYVDLSIATGHNGTMGHILVKMQHSPTESGLYSESEWGTS